jgi:hypothetical protein
LVGFISSSSLCVCVCVCVCVRWKCRCVMPHHSSHRCVMPQQTSTDEVGCASSASLCVCARACVLTHKHTKPHTHRLGCLDFLSLCTGRSLQGLHSSRGDL